MSITIGTQLGSYEITGLLGKGGMGAVYRSRDSKLKREVAIKILPEEFSRDHDRLSRFQREAEILAALNHPNIAAIHDLQEANGERFLVLELVEGETLAERIQRGSLPVNEALSVAGQICDALESAHEKGIIHRDLKPANVKITPDGKVKVLDFGLAKVKENAPVISNLSNSPTLSMAATQAGVIFGTAGYMSPEQAKGFQADARSDVFSLGCMLYEMLTGQQTFQGDTAAEILAAVLLREPDFNRLPPKLHPRVRELVCRCLEKNPKRRWHAVADLRMEMEAISSKAESARLDVEVTPPAIAKTRLLLKGSLFMLAVAILLYLWAPWRTPSRVPAAAPIRLSAELGADVSLVTIGGMGQIGDTANASLAVSPDGSVLAFVGIKNGVTPQIYLRRLGQLQAIALPGTDNAINPFFSPDSQWIGFFSDGKLKKISVTGGAAVTLCDVPQSRGGWWGPDGDIIFSPDSQAGTTLQRISSAGGGKPESVTTLKEDEVTQRWPQILPGGKALLYTSSRITSSFEDARIVVQPLPTGTPIIVATGGYYGRYLDSGHVVYVHDRTLFAVPFDLDRLQVAGQSVPVLEDVSTQNITGSSHFTFSNAGTLIYLPGQGGDAAPMFWMRRDGKTLPLRPSASDWSGAAFAPDGLSLALEIFDGKQSDIWLYDWLRDALTPLTSTPGQEEKPVWTPDGRRIVFRSDRDNANTNLYWQRSDGSGEAERLTRSPNQQVPGSWHPSGKFLAFYERNPQTRNDVMILPIEGDEASGLKAGKPMPFLNGPANETEPAFSPDGKWIAYQSTDSGRSEVFVTSFPGPGRRSPISTAGGAFPTWSRTRPELFYVSPTDNRIMISTYDTTGGSFKAAKPYLFSEQSILPRRRPRSFDLHRDGERVVVALATDRNEYKRDKVVFIFNFFDELQRKAPATK